MFCANCSEKISGKAIRQAGELYCSLECANAASGVDPEEEGYYEEASLDEFYQRDDE